MTGLGLSAETTPKPSPGSGLQLSREDATCARNLPPLSDPVLCVMQALLYFYYI
jgi:hypothetical protein